MELALHVGYIHYNPVQHGWVSRPVDWPHQRCTVTLNVGWRRRIGVRGCVMAVVVMASGELLGFTESFSPTYRAVQLSLREFESEQYK
jgi:hypothetical protein